MKTNKVLILEEDDILNLIAKHDIQTTDPKIISIVPEVKFLPSATGSPIVSVSDSCKHEIHIKYE